MKKISRFLNNFKIIALFIILGIIIIISILLFIEFRKSKQKFYYNLINEIQNEKNITLDVYEEMAKSIYDSPA